MYIIMRVRCMFHETSSLEAAYKILKQVDPVKVKISPRIVNNGIRAIRNTLIARGVLDPNDIWDVGRRA